MNTYTPTQRTKIRRLGKRAVYDKPGVHAILDEGFICHLGFTLDAQPYVIPTSYARSEDLLYIHGSGNTRHRDNIQISLPGYWAMKNRVAIVTTLGSTQSLAWASSYYLPAVLAAPIAHDIGLSRPWIYAPIAAWYAWAFRFFQRRKTRCKELRAAARAIAAWSNAAAIGRTFLAGIDFAQADASACRSQASKNPNAP